VGLEIFGVLAESVGGQFRPRVMAMTSNGRMSVSIAWRRLYSDGRLVLCCLFETRAAASNGHRLGHKFSDSSSLHGAPLEMSATTSARSACISQVDRRFTTQQFEPAKRADDLARVRLHVQRCHDVVTTRCELRESAGDGKRRLLLVRKLPDSLQDNGIHTMSD
jgi:hypothetical protein